MSDSNRHSPAFPTPDYDKSSNGLTKLEYAAIHIMAGVMARTENKPQYPETVAYEAAEKLFDELEIIEETNEG